MIRAALRRPRWHWLMAAALLVAGCKEQPEIRSYTVAKEPLPAATAQSQPQAGRMLGAIIPHGDTGWFLKLTGPEATIEQHAEAFAQFAKSLKFSSGGNPGWELPSGWQEKPAQSAMTFATIQVASDPPLELTVTKLPWRSDDADGQILANVNRWRGQMTLPPIAVTDLDKETTKLKLVDGEATLVDLKGKLAPGRMPGMAAKGPDQVAQAQPANQPAANPPTADLPFTFQTPDGWNDSPPPPFAVAAFTVNNGEQQVQITITPLAGAGGGMLSNVNRWRSQIGLPAIAEAELAGAMKPYKVDGHEGRWVELVAPADANPRQAITVVAVPHGNLTWFFRMRGAADSVSRQQTAFEDFVTSVKFKPANP